ncbi:MAG TPA: J domain-containing protein [Stellaceae bacterium]|nr:J domain-containing protein [Stellaceae bacterium]
MWEELGIAPTSDARAIRRAYAQRLRDAHPDRDPQAFQRLRLALERAIAWAERSSGGAEPSEILSEEDEGAFGEEAREPPPTDDIDRAEPPEIDPEDDLEAAAARRRFEAAGAAVDTEAAFAEFSRSAARGLWSLTEQERFVADLMKVAVEDLDLPVARFAEIARAADWDRPLAWHGEEWRALRERVLERLAAERWYTELKTIAAGSGGNFEARQQRQIARAFLGRLPRWRMRLIARDSIERALEEYERHQPWVLRLVSREHADYLVWLRDTHLEAKASWSGKSGKKKGGGSFPIIFVIVAIQVVLAVLRGCHG